MHSLVKHTLGNFIKKFRETQKYFVKLFLILYTSYQKIMHVIIISGYESYLFEAENVMIYSC